MKNYPAYVRYTLIIFLLLNIIGCEAFIRKFTRKPNKENIPQEEMVVAPEEYKSSLSNEELYRQYLLYWKAWHEELITSIRDKRSIEKQLDCADQAMKNLLNIRAMLKDQKQKELDIYINRLRDIRDDISQDTAGFYSIPNTNDANRLLMEIWRGFSYEKVKGYL